MYDPTIHSRTIARQLKANDFKSDPSLFNEVARRAKIDAAVDIGRQGFNSVDLRENILRGKFVYQLNDLSDELVVRLLKSNIKRVTSVKQDNREIIVSCIKTLLETGTPYRLYKYDIASFYESVSIHDIVKQLSDDIAFSGQSIRAISSFFEALQAKRVAGLPRGMSISATLAEYVMRSFDQSLTKDGGIWFYARFVDDILVITNGTEDPADFHKNAQSLLPPGLKFNAKSGCHDLSAFSRPGSTDEEKHVDFLGYRFSISSIHRNSNNIKLRKVRVDIANSKVRKIKTKIARSLLAYKVDKDFELLHDRIKFLTSNFAFVDNKKDVRINAGIFFNYPMITQEESRSLPILDKYLRNTICSSHPKNKLKPVLSSSQRQRLLNLTFTGGFTQKRFFSFKPARLHQITSCWSYA